MKITKYRRSLQYTYLKTTCIMLFIGFLLMKGFILFEHTGDNLFHVYINDIKVGTVASTEIAEKLLVQARKELAMESAEILFMDINMTFEGEEMLWGYIDEEEHILENLKIVLNFNTLSTMHHSYTVKVNEYMVNLASIEDVKTLLQASVDKFDRSESFGIELVQDNIREFNVLTANITDMVVKEQQEEEKNTNVLIEAGIQAQISQLFDSYEPEERREFSDYDLGIMDMEFPQKVEIVEAYLPANQLKPVAQAIEDVTKEQEHEKIYEVISGDTLSEIAIKVDIPMDKLIELNDGLENENSMIRVGQELIITIPEPELSVQRMEVNYYEEIYDADIIYVDNDEWYTTQTVTLQDPSAGFRKIVAEETFLNDTKVGREILKEEVIMEAIPKIVERGTRIPPTYIKPVAGGRVSSTFGKRSAPTKGASTYHKAVDWAVATGTEDNRSEERRVGKEWRL